MKNISVLKSAIKGAVTLQMMALLSLPLVSCSFEESAREKRPNVIMIMTDDQGYGDLGCHGSPYVKTPNLDLLHEESIRFSNYHVDPCCSPTRAALLTGCYSSRAGVLHTVGGRHLLNENMPTIADVFSQNGYETAIFGKWHLGDSYPFRPHDRGFKESVVHGGGVVGSTADYWGNNYYDDTYLHNGEFKQYEGYCNTIWVEEAVSYMKKNKDKPFFIYLSTNLPHEPLSVDEEYIEPYRDQVSERLARFYGMITKFDEDMGYLIKELKEMGLEENTILIFKGDNGPCPWFGGIIIDMETGFVKEGYSAGMRGGKIWGYENAHRVPLFIRWPGGDIGEGRDIEALSAHIDIMPTLVDLCNLDIPVGLHNDGQSLAPLLTGEIKDWQDDRTVFVHNQRVDHAVKDKEYQVLTQNWRLVKREKDELYNIIDDPGQRHDIAGQHPDIVKDLYGRYQVWWEDISDALDKYAEIHIGAEQENPVRLNSHDAFSRQGENIWVVNVQRDGKYEITLNRWPEESGKRIVENRDGDQDLPVEYARLKVGNIDLTEPVTSDITNKTFVVSLKSGTTCLHTSFVLKDNGQKLPALRVNIEYMGDASQLDLINYVPSIPELLLEL
jgi:arylsulfatase A-like enzyme